VQSEKTWAQAGEPMKAFLTVAVVFAFSAAADAAQRAVVLPFETAENPTPPSKIDDLVFAKLRKQNIPIAPFCSDAVFVRRAFLDAIGTLPTAQETKAFLTDQNPKKRRVLIDRLLDRKEFADYWTVKWCDLLRVKSEYPINLWPNAAQGYHHWIHGCIQANMPYDRFVRSMLTASGSNFDEPRVNFYRAIQGREPTNVAQAVALTFMGVRPEGWPQDRWTGMSAFFSQIGYKPTGQWKEEIVLFDPSKGVSDTASTAATAADAAGDKGSPGLPPPPNSPSPIKGVFPDGATVEILPGQDPREVFANWLITSKNPWFARNIVNRAWSWFLGRGIIHEPDDIRPGNAPCNPELLAYLERELVASHYDLKHIFRLILNSKTYQLSSIPESVHPKGNVYFSHYPARRLEAEVLIDAICQISGANETYSSPIPEPFTFIPEEQRSIELPDGSISSSFLEMFGRPSRDTGLESERINRSTAEQQLHLLNSSHIRRKIEQGPKIRSLLQTKGKPKDVVEQIYLTILSRMPTEEELQVMKDYAQPGQKGRRPMLDLVWALINSAEFLYRH
jgi:hypothetical protein